MAYLDRQFFDLRLGFHLVTRRQGDAIERAEPVVVEMPIMNTDRTVGTILGSEVSLKYGEEGLPDDTITLRLTGSAGQSLGAFCPRGITIDVQGDANDFTGKGLSGGKIVVMHESTVSGWTIA